MLRYFGLYMAVRLVFWTMQREQQVFRTLNRWTWPPFCYLRGVHEIFWFIYRYKSVLGDKFTTCLGEMFKIAKFFRRYVIKFPNISGDMFTTDELLNASGQMFTSSVKFQETCLPVSTCFRTHVYHLLHFFRKHVCQLLHISGYMFTSFYIF